MGDLISMIGFLGCLYYLGCFIKALIIRWPIGEYLVGLGWSAVALFSGFALTAMNDPTVDKLVLCASLIALVAFTALKYGGLVLEKAGKALGKLKKKLGIRGLPEIIEVKYLGTITTDSKRGGFKGAFLGGFLYGDTGAAIGGMMPTGSKTLCRFAVRYDNGEVKLVDCHKTDPRYKKFMSYVRWEDL